MLASHELPRLQHDEIVLQQAMSLLSSGYQVQARLEGLFEFPSTIYGYRPDVVATLGNQIVIVEVVKGNVDFPKIVALKRYAAENPGKDLRIVNVGV